MAESTSDKPAIPGGSPAWTPAREAKPRVRSSLFRYYIHDSIHACRLQLIGDLSEAEIAELTGCWNTARTTLGMRKLLLDLKGVKSVDVAGKQWISSMVAEGAVCEPETFLRDHIAGRAYPETIATAKAGIFARILSVFRGSRPVPAE